MQRCQGDAEHLRDRGLEPLVGVGDRQLHAGQAASDEPAQELGPEGLRVALADVERDHLAPARLVHAVGDHEALAHDAPAVSDLLDLRVEPEVGIAALERAGAERLDLLVEALTARETSDFETRNPSDSTTWSALLVETPAT